MLPHLNTGGTGSNTTIMTSIPKSHKTVPMLSKLQQTVHMMNGMLIRIRVALMKEESRMIAHIQTFKKGRLTKLTMLWKVLVVRVKGFPWMLKVKSNQELLSRLLRRNGQS